MKKTYVVLATMLVIISVSLAASAQNATLKGIVSEDFTGDPIRGATVSVFLDGKPLRSTVSGPDGKYSLKGLPANKVLTRFSMLGYSPDPDDIEKSLVGGDNDQNVSLVRQSTSSDYWKAGAAKIREKVQRLPANQQQSAFTSEWNGLLSKHLPPESLVIAAQGFVSVIGEKSLPQSASEISRVNLTNLMQARAQLDSAFKAKSQIPAADSPLLSPFPDAIKEDLYIDAFSRTVPKQDRGEYIKLMEKGDVVATRKTLDVLKNIS